MAVEAESGVECSALHARLPDVVARLLSLSFLTFNKLHIMKVYNLKLQGYMVQHREYSQYFIITINRV